MDQYSLNSLHKNHHNKDWHVESLSQSLLENLDLSIFYKSYTLPVEQFCYSRSDFESLHYNQVSDLSSGGVVLNPPKSSGKCP